MSAAVLLTSCASAPPSSNLKSREPPAAATAFSGDAAADWNHLVLMPFGTLLKASPVPLHEVLLFRDEAHPGTPLDGRECYTPNGALPTFFGAPPEEYLLCFSADRLDRIEASVSIAAVDAAARFAHACRTWLKEAVPQAAIGGACEGLEDGVLLHARLASLPEEARATVSLTLTAAPALKPAPAPAPATAPAP
jgi:hypothetical protein